jgi:diguanylate cyclase (GGDEF)-like protein
MVEVAAGRGLAGRFGVDEFALLLTGLTSPFEAVEIAEVLSARLAAPSRLTVGTVAVGASIGVAVAEAGITVAELTRRADEAMYAAKAAGKNRVEAFRPAATCPTPYTPPPASRPPWVAREASARGAAR